MINVPKGTKDILPEESYKWQYIEKTAREVARIFGVKEIKTPTFEHTEVFERGVGDTTDIVNKEMYTFLDKGGRSITLKPEGTAGVARAFIENGLNNSALPVKLYYLTSCFRYERPQAGRLREFHQFGVEVLGAETPFVDAEVILMAKTFFDKLKISNLTLYINSIGCKDCRKAYLDALKEYYKDNIDTLCPLCRERLEKNPMRILDCKNDSCKTLNKNAPKILDYLCEDCSVHFEKVKTLLKSAGVEYKINAEIVRGLDYYSKTVFEFVSENIGAQGTVCGGGRYDGLVEQLGGKPTCAIGFAIGLERLLLLLESLELSSSRAPVDYVICYQGENTDIAALKLGDYLRKELTDTRIMTCCGGGKLKKQLAFADKVNAKLALIIGEEELANNTVTVKNLSLGEQASVKQDELASYLNSLAK